MGHQMSFHRTKPVNRQNSIWVLRSFSPSPAQIKRSTILFAHLIEMRISIIRVIYQK
jgi:hypothetical protein